MKKLKPSTAHAQRAAGDTAFGSLADVAKAVALAIGASDYTWGLGMVRRLERGHI